MDAPDAYHLWNIEKGLPFRILYLGVPIIKLVEDLWNYQEIITSLRPGLVVEFGTWNGGSALYFAEILRTVNPGGLVFTVCAEDQRFDIVKQHPLIQFCFSDSKNPAVGAEIHALRVLHPGPIFAILDSDHNKAHVLAEMELLREILVAGDYLVVEDGNINGHPVLPGWGPGPWEALEEYKTLHPEDYKPDVEREAMFGFTFAPNGYLVRC